MPALSVAIFTGKYCPRYHPAVGFPRSKPEQSLRLKTTTSLLGHIAIFTDDPGWHGARLKRAFAARGFDAYYVSLTACRLNLEGSGPPIVIPGFSDRLPDGAFVRGVPGGSLEQVTFYLDILHGLKHLDIPVYNDARAIERTVDKGMTSFLMQQAGIPTPATWVVNSQEEALEIAKWELEQGHHLVSKPLFGSQGEGLQRHEKPEDLEYLAESNGVFYLQRFIHCGEQSHDFRVFVIHGKTVAAMRRFGHSWLNNVAQGGRCETVRLDDLLLCRLAEDAVRTVGMAYAGVDIIRDMQGRYAVIEVNSVPAWKGLQSVSEVVIADLLADDFLSLCASRHGQKQAGNQA
jgi:RimK family alpha-L-glutamate ligase